MDGLESRSSVDQMPSTVSHYTVLSRLGRGGMGEVYLGLDETLQRRVALKALHADHRLKPHARARFLREARILSQLDHPRICRIYDYVVGDDSDFLVLELIAGRTLADRLRDGQRLSDGLDIAEQIADVLVAAHAAGVVHRDLKPGNVMVAADGGVKVLDFGLASSGAGPGEPDQPADGADDAPRATRVARPQHMPAHSPDASDTSDLTDRTAVTLATSTALFQTGLGQVMGTPAYMSPEQALGEAAGAPSDMYSFGLLLQELSTGVPAYDLEEDLVLLLGRAARAETRPATGIDADLAGLIQRLKAPAPTQRPTAVETAERLRWIRDKPKRRFRRLVAAAALVGLALAGAKYTVDLARERTVAVEAREEADRRRDQAENLIGFMVGDLRAKLEPVGRLEILDDVGDQAMAYFASVPEDTLSDEELSRFSRALYQIGDVRIARGNLDEATAPLERSLALAGALLEREPDAPERLFELGQSHFWVGFVHWRRRNLNAALEHFEHYFEVSDRLVRMAPDNGAWQLELAMANSNIGSVLEEQGNLPAALGRYQTTFGIVQSLVDDAPADTVLQELLASTHNTIGETLRAQGRLSEALERHRTELTIREQLAAADPGNSSWRAYLATSESFVGALLEVQGDNDGARQYYDRAIATFEALVALDDENSTWQHGLARNLFKQGRVQLSTGDVAAARGTLRRSVDVLVQLVNADPTQRWRRDLALARVSLGHAQVALGALPSAERQALDALAMAEDLTAADPTDQRSSLIRGLTYQLLGRLRAAEGQQTEASSAHQRALDILGAIARESNDPELLAPWAGALLAGGRAADADAIIERLSAMGYRGGDGDTWNPAGHSAPRR